MAQLDANTIVIDIQDKDGDDILEFCAPGVGGAVTITEAHAINHQSTTGNTSFTVALIRYSNSGTRNVIGTVAAAVGGTGDHWIANTPKEMTINNDHDVLNKHEWLALRTTSQNNGTATFGKVVIHYVGGKA